MTREHSIIKEGKLKLPDDMLVIVFKNGSVVVNRGDHTMMAKSETGLVLVDLEKQLVYPDYL